MMQTASIALNGYIDTSQIRHYPTTLNYPPDLQHLDDTLMNKSPRTTQNIALTVGKIVFCCQQIEQHFKAILPFTNSDDPNFGSIISRHQKLEKRPLGELSGHFVAAASGHTTELEAFIRSIVDKRNAVVHHFFETHGPNISNGQHEAVLADLKAQHEEAMSLLKILRAIFLAILESMPESNTLDQNSNEALAQLCEIDCAN